MYFDVESNEFKDVDKAAAKLCFAGADRNISWQDLKNLSDQICIRLEEAKIPEGAPVIVYGEKEVFFLASLLSCFRKKIPFVPIEPSLPASRIDNIITQTKSRAIIVCGDHPNVPKLPLCITNDLSIEGNTSFETVYPETAYILFTSGSSGQPKGVLVSRKNIISFVQWLCKDLPVSSRSVVINQASFLFDISLADLFGALHAGGSAIFNFSEQVENGEFFSRIQNMHGNYWNSTPSFISYCLTNKDFNATHFPEIKNFILSGEDLSPSLVSELIQRFPSSNVINAYGPTEACIFSSKISVKKNMLHAHSLPISHFPTQHFVIENDELIINGPQVAQGYLGGAKFNGRFASGDLVEERGGLLFYKGRIDDQIKFNGYRIELNEIKSVLEAHASVAKAECLPLVVHKKIKRLVAFVQLKDPDKNQVAELKEFLAMHLPTYMIPSEIIPVTEFPYTGSFKTDKKKLLETYLNL